MIKLPSLTPAAKVTKPASVVGLKQLKSKKPRNQQFKRIIKVLVGVLGVVLIWLGFVIIKYNPLAISQINFKSADLACVSNDQLKNFLKINQYNLLSLDTHRLEQQAKERFVCISMIEIDKKFPSTVEVRANDHQQVAIVRVFQLPSLDLNLDEATSSTQAAEIADQTSQAKEDGRWVIDEAGVVMKSEKEEENLPVIDYYNQEAPIRLGSSLPAGVVDKTLKLLNDLKTAQLEVKSIKIIDNSLTFADGTTYIFSLTKDPAKQFAALQLILHQAAIDSKKVQKIDLRFDKAVVVYSTKQGSG